MKVFTVTLNQMAVVLIFICCGYAFKKLKMYGDSFSHTLSKLEVDVFMPALVFGTFSANFTVKSLGEKWVFVAAGAAILVINFVLSLPLASAFTKDRYERCIYSYGFTSPNFGYIGYPLITAVFGEEMRYNTMMFTIPLNFYIYTLGIYMLNPNREMNLKKLFNPTMVAMLLGMLVGVFKIKLPDFVSGAVSSAGGCVGCVSMIMLGYVLADASFKATFTNVRYYIASFIRLIALPAMAGAVLYFGGAKTDLVLVASATLALPLGLNVVIFPEAYGGDSSLGAQQCLMSNLLAVITIPVVFGILTAVSR